MNEWVGNAHGDQSVRYGGEKRVGRFDFRGGQFFKEPIVWVVDDLLRTIAI
jgi:hypothetical protein